MEWTVGWWQVSVQRVYPTSNQLSQTYNQAAGRWHQQLQLLGYRYAYQTLWRSLQSSHNLSSWNTHSTLCDCGIGTAAFSLSLAHVVGSTVQITGVDLSSSMLKTAHHYLSQANISHQLCQSDVIALPFSDCAFDGVISAHMLEHLPNPLQGLQEMLRVLKPGAPMVLVVTRAGLLGSLIEWHWGNRCFSPDDLANLMQQAGLTHVQYIPFSVGLARFSSIACIGFRRPLWL